MNRIFLLASTSCHYKLHIQFPKAKQPASTTSTETIRMHMMWYTRHSRALYCRRIFVLIFIFIRLWSFRLFELQTERETQANSPTCIKYFYFLADNENSLQFNEKKEKKYCASCQCWIWNFMCADTLRPTHAHSWINWRSSILSRCSC